MKTNNIMKNLKYLLVATFSTIIVGCVDGDHYGVVSSECHTETATVKIVDDLLVNATTTPQVYQSATDSILEAYVTSSDESGNFYKTISMVAFDDNDNQFGFSIPVDQYNLFNEFEPGRKVYINMNGLNYGFENDGLVIGGDVFNGDIGRIALNEYKKIILRSCEKVNEDDLVNYISVGDAEDDQYLNKLIEFTDVQFDNSSLGGNYFNPNNTAGSGTNHNLNDANSSDFVLLRVSEYATEFKDNKVPFGKGRVRGVQTKYCYSSGGCDYQFLIRTENDVKLDSARDGFSFFNSLDEPFTSFGAYVSDFDSYYNFATIGFWRWQVRSFSGNNYLQMSSYGSGEENRALFVIPVNFDNISDLSFKTKDGYNNGDVLKVYYSLDDLVSPDNNSKVDITSNFTIASGSSSSYAANFTDSGVYTFENLSGNGYIIFEYTGEDYNVTTTMQIDDIVIN